MNSNFTTTEKRRWALKKHLKDHAFEYTIDIIGTMLIAYILMKISKAENIAIGIAAAFAFALGRVCQQIHHYKKEHIDMDIKETSTEQAENK